MEEVLVTMVVVVLSGRSAGDNCGGGVEWKKCW